MIRYSQLSLTSIAFVLTLTSQATTVPKDLNSKDTQWPLAMLDADRKPSANTPDAPIVAIIDTGGDVTHTDLAGSLWTNPGESGRDSFGRDRATNGIDDDANGFVDDVHGWNFIDRSSTLVDTNGHGTHIAGIIARVAPGAKLMILKYYDKSAKDQTLILSTIQAIDYAVKMGAKIINYSAGGGSSDPREKAAIARAGEAGVVFITAAGNEGRNADQVPYYPAAYRLLNILSVTSVSAERELLASGNYGVDTVDLAAPGDAIHSALPGGRRGEMTGTSQATAFASGVAAKLLSARPTLDVYELKKVLLASAQPASALTGKVRSEGILNLRNALTLKGFETAHIVSAPPKLFDPSSWMRASNRD